MASLYPPLPGEGANMREVFAMQKQLETMSRAVFDAWSEFTTANVQLEKASVRETIDAATEQTTEFNNSLRLFEPDRQLPKDSFFVAMIPVLQQLNYNGAPPSTVSAMRATLQELMGRLRETPLTASMYGALKQYLKSRLNLSPQQPWEVYLGLMLQKQEPIVKNSTKEQVLEFVSSPAHGANVMTLRMFSEALEVKFLILSTRMESPSESQERMRQENGFYITCLGSTQTPAQKYVLLLYDQSVDYYAVYYVFQADGSRRYIFSLNTLPSKLINAYLQLCDATDEVTDFEKAAPQLLLERTTEAVWSSARGSQ